MRIIRDNRGILLDSVKKAVARYGLTGLSTRNIAETAGVFDAVIYRYFRDKDDLVRQAYESSSSEIILAIVKSVNETRELSAPIEEKARLVFRRTWRELLSDTDRLTLVTSYYNSAYFKRDRSCHLRQLEMLTSLLGDMFPSEGACHQTLYSLMTVLYDSAVRVADGNCENSEETQGQIFAIFFCILKSHLRRELISP